MLTSLWAAGVAIAMAALPAWAVSDALYADLPDMIPNDPQDWAKLGGGLALAFIMFRAYSSLVHLVIQTVQANTIAMTRVAENLDDLTQEIRRDRTEVAPAIATKLDTLIREVRSVANRGLRAGREPPR